MVTTLTAIGGLVGIVSLVFLALQTRAVSQQVRAANNITGLQSLDQQLAALREIHFKMLDYPGMRAYFYDSRPCPRRGAERERVLIFADSLADVLDSGIQATRRLPENESEEDWISFCRYVVSHSPTLRAVVSEHSNWWPDLSRMC
ncbi:hypothetical protein [Streptomyces sp. NBC_00343]|uniref:hypothetical protein n=1 Tax=Streptomyces sp. NBC_00343 TaxID=2975719 RepID=UPI002E29B5F0|nr:hypothetical protein [Streptomyces sp. NBC_00343]